MRHLLLPILLLLLGCSLEASTPRLRLPVEDANPETLPSSFGEAELAVLLQNPDHRKALTGREIDVVGELTLFSKPDPETGLIKQIGFGKTHGKVLYRVWCKLKEPISQAEFNRISASAFVTLRGICSVHCRTKAAGSDLWYDISVTLANGAVIYLSDAREGKR